MTPLDLLDQVGSGPLFYRVNGETRGPLPVPSDLHPQAILVTLERGHFPLEMLDGIPIWKTDALFARWVAHHDLPAFRDAQRLCYLVNRYPSELEYDLAMSPAHEDLGTLFRARRWRYLLNLIDRIPSHTYYGEAVQNDEEHAEMIARAEAEAKRGGDAKKWTPPLRIWTPEMDIYSRILDTINALRSDMVTLKTGKQGSMPELTPRPSTLLDDARKRAVVARKESVHKSLVAQLLPHKAQQG